MSLIKKLKRITLSRIEAFLDTLENPEYILPQLQKELAGKLDQAINAQAKSLTAVKSARRKLDELEGKLLRYDKLVTAAVAEKDEQLARKILSAQIQVEEEKGRQQSQLQGTEQAYLQAKQVCEQLKKSLDSLKQKVRDLKYRDTMTKQMQAMQRKAGWTDDCKADSILEAVARMEEKVIERESEVEVRQEMTHLLLDDDSIEELEKKAEVDRRLAELLNNNKNN